MPPRIVVVALLVAPIVRVVAAPNAFTVVEAETGKKMIYDSKEIFLGHRNQKKPTDYDVINITEVDNTNILKIKNVKQEKQTSVTDLLLSRVTC